MKLYNGKPGARIPDHVIKRFVPGVPYSYYSPLASLENRLGSLRYEWRKIRSPDAIIRARYPAAGSDEEWRDEILNPDQLLVEGFRER